MASSYGFNTVRGYLSEKRVKGGELISYSIMIIVSILLIYGGVLILQDEDIFKKVYEGFSTEVTGISVPSSGTCPTGRSLYTIDLNQKSESMCFTDCASNETFVYADNTPVTASLDPTKYDFTNHTNGGLKCITNKGSSSSNWSAELPEDLTLGSLQKNVGLIRKKSQSNILVGYAMIGTGSIIALYQTYSLFF